MNNIDKNTCVCGGREFETVNIYANSKLATVRTNGLYSSNFEIKVCTKCGTVKYVR